MQKKLILLLILILLWATVVAFAQESITITTYYPSPYGSYRQLQADQIAIGSGYRNPTYADGSLYVEGNVGIGTTSPQTIQDGRTIRLDVAKNIVAEDIYLDNPKSGNPRWASEGGIVPTGLYGYCIDGSGCGSCAGPVYAPATCPGATGCGGTGCLCPAGYTKVSLIRAPYDSPQPPYSCYKN